MIKLEKLSKDKQNAKHYALFVQFKKYVYIFL